MSSEDSESDSRDRSEAESIGVPNLVVSSGSLDRLVDTARDYAKQATAVDTNKAYAKDWKHFSSWWRGHGADPLAGPPCPDPQLISLYIVDCVGPADVTGATKTKVRPLAAVSTLERRLSGLA